MDDEKLTEQQFATTVFQLPESVAEYAGYDFATQHVCLDCGCRVGGKALVRHAKEHARAAGTLAKADE